MIVQDHIELVKVQIRYHRYILANRPPDRLDPQKHEAFIKKWEQLLVDLEKLAQKSGSSSKRKPSPVPLTRPSANDPAPILEQEATPLLKRDLSDLPEELLDELGLTQGDQVEIQIEQVINSVGRALSVNEVLIALFRSTSQIHKRKALATKLYRMVKKGSLVSVPDKKGHYLTPVLADEIVPSRQSELS